MRVLFIGNSHTYFNDMPQLFARMVERLTGAQPEVTMLAYSDRSLQWHREEYFSVRFALLYGRYDYCVLQQQAHPFPGEATTFEHAKRIFSLCPPHTKPVVYMTWAQRGDAENAARMSACYRKLAAECRALCVPIGELFAQVQQSNPEIDLYWTDGAHASAYGDWLIAAAFAAMLTGRRELSALPETGMDFQVNFDGPTALENPALIHTLLDTDKIAALRRAVEQMM